MVALDFLDEDYKINVLCIPEEYAGVEIADINIEKLRLDAPIRYAAFSDLIKWLYDEFKKRKDVMFTFICSVDSLDIKGRKITHQMYRWLLFDRLYQRAVRMNGYNQERIMVQDAVIGQDDYQSYGRVFYRDIHAPIVHLIAAHLLEKQG